MPTPPPSEGRAAGALPKPSPPAPGAEKDVSPKAIPPGTCPMATSAPRARRPRCSSRGLSFLIRRMGAQQGCREAKSGEEPDDAGHVTPPPRSLSGPERWPSPTAARAGRSGSFTTKPALPQPVSAARGSTKQAPTRHGGPGGGGPPQPTPTLRKMPEQLDPEIPWKKAN